MSWKAYHARFKVIDKEDARVRLEVHAAARLHRAQSFQCNVLLIRQAQADQKKHHGVENWPNFASTTMATQRLRRKLERDGAPERVNLGESFVTVRRASDAVRHTAARPQ